MRKKVAWGVVIFIDKSKPSAKFSATHFAKFIWIGQKGQTDRVEGCSPPKDPEKAGKAGYFFSIPQSINVPWD